MPSLIRSLAILAAITVLAASCELQEQAGPHVGDEAPEGLDPPTVGVVGATGVERVVEDEPASGDEDPVPTTSTPPSTTGPASTTTAAPTTVPPTTTAAPTTTVAPPTTSTPPTTTSTPPTTTSSPPTTTSPPPAGTYINDFATFDRFTDEIDHGVQYRDPWVVHHTQWEGDHAQIGTAADGSPQCGGPDTKRTLTRENMAEHVYWCDVGTGHVMTSQGDTTGYGWAWFKPKQTFQDVTEVRWDVNVTHLGNRQFTEVMVIPAHLWELDSSPGSLFDGDDDPSLPCLQIVFEFPCLTFEDGDAFGSAYAGFEAIGVSTFNQEMIIATQDGSEIAQHGLPDSDPARSSVAIRRTHFFRDNQNGTVTFGVEREDGSFLEHTVAGAFPNGEVMVVFKDHNYTPLKSETGSLVSPMSFTWHWDNIVVNYGS